MQVLINENLYNHLIRLVYNRTNILIEGAYKVSNEQGEELLYFWAFGDLHYRARDQWHAMHARRLAPMFQDARSLWLDQGAPAFCVSPGDIVDTGARENYTLATKDIAAQLGNIAFYPGIGNHEFHAESREDTVHTAAEFSAAWDMPVRYAWTAGEGSEVVCIMLDQPDPYKPDPLREKLRQATDRGFKAIKLGWKPFGRRDANTDELLVRTRAYHLTSRGLNARRECTVLSRLPADGTARAREKTGRQ